MFTVLVVTDLLFFCASQRKSDKFDTLTNQVSFASAVSGDKDSVLSNDV